METVSLSVNECLFIFVGDIITLHRHADPFFPHILTLPEIFDLNNTDLYGSKGHQKFLKG